MESYQNTEEILVMNQDVFYERQERGAVQTLRELSDTIFLKKFNNFIKTQLIQQFCRATGGSGLSVLDLCGGRGGDLFKWDQQQIAHYIGVDLSTSLVEEA